MRLISLLFAVLFATPSWAVIAIDPNNAAIDQNTTNATSGATSGAFTAANSGELIVVVEACGNGSAPPTPQAPTDNGPGLTYTMRSSRVSGNYVISVWAGQAPGAFSATVTAHWSAACGDLCTVVFGVHNNNTSSPWDSNGSLPAYSTGSSSNPTTGPISTTKPNTLLLSAQGVSGYGGTLTGWTHVPNGKAQNFGGCCVCNNTADYNVVSTTQSGVSATYGTSVGAWITIGDAIDDASQPATGKLMFKSGPGW
jgi:hypothetical protein